MTSIEKRIALGYAEGWKDIKLSPIPCAGDWPDGPQVAPQGLSPDGKGITFLPHYECSHEAIAPLEEKLDLSFKSQYGANLVAATVGSDKPFYRATASQRADACLITLGLMTRDWKRATK